MIDQAIIIRDKTRLEQLIERFNSKAQARFYIERSGGNFLSYEEEHQTFYQSLDRVTRSLGSHIRYKNILREYLPSFIFSANQVILVLGQDGLVANAAKYVENQPIIGINPDPVRYDGILLPFSPDNFLTGLKQVLDNGYTAGYVTMAEAKLKDGQKLLAFNDLFIGPATHRSARYELRYRGKAEVQSSSGIIVSTGAGSTGWLSSVFNMAQSVSQAFSGKMFLPTPTLPWNTDELVFVVREPFLSRHSEISLTAGKILKRERLEIESRMPQQGVIFSDGIESDFLRFDSGAIAGIGIADQQACLVRNTLP
ncbi:MAG: sugar kinase [Bacteroidia bacterium]|nr:sugar kinase [Bacteroidia bacterium]